jgi:uncharacterized protein (UPF0276 family)
MTRRNRPRPLIGLLYSSAAPSVIDAAGALVESLDVTPERFFYDLGPDHATRFHRVDGALRELQRHAAGRHTSGHGTGLSLPTDRPLDEALLDVVDGVAETIGFAWYSEHLTSFVTMRGDVPNAHAGRGLRVPYDDDVLTLLAAKVERVQERLGMRLLLENPAVFSPGPGCDYREPEFLNELARRTGCGVLLDLHNLYVNERNNHEDCDDYLELLDLDNVVEIHVSGGTELFGGHRDSHPAVTPPRVWELAADYLPAMPSLVSVIVEFHESCVDRTVVPNLVAELERMHEIVDEVPTATAA